ncbi:MAG TPA: serine/threonine-protein kinase, partial [Kofleriaceae bacterium]
MTAAWYPKRVAGDKTTAGSRSIEHAGVVRTFEHSTVFAPGHIVATRYRVIRFIARGGMGEVYEVEDLELHLSVAMKTISSERVNDRRQIERMKREILLARRITHPNICRVFDVGYHVEDDVEIVFLTMELIVGESLDRRIARLGPFSVEDARPLVRQMADALAAAHAAGVIHRDFKSQNILLVEDRSASGNPLRVIVTDFGLARSCEGDASVTTDFAGTPAYMAPEQITGDAIEPAVDLYALGVTTFEMVTGQLPFDGPSPLAITVKKCQEPAPEARTLRTDLDARWSAAIARALERDPRRRFASPHELVAALEPGRPMPRRTARAMTVAGAAAVVLGGSAAFWLATQRSASYGPVRTRSGRLAFSVGGPGVEAIEGLAFDAERNLYIAGHTTAAFEFRGHHIPSFNRSSKTSFVIA